MNAILRTGLPSMLAFQRPEQMSEGPIDVWRRQYVHDQMSLHQWHHSQALPVGNIHDPEFKYFHSESRDYDEHIHHEGGPLISPPMSYVPETSWASDMDMETPSTAGFPTSEPVDNYHNMRHNTAPHHLNMPPRHERVQSNAQSPRSSYGEPNSAKEDRPNLFRSITAPASSTDHRPRRLPNNNVSGGAPLIKRTGSEDEEDEYVPNGGVVKPRARKRQRIPHTAVERRYRENLNAHLDKLRQTVPALASKPGEGIGEGVKPSKCEILIGAIEHIGALDIENSGLKTEVRALRSRLEDLERWCNSGTLVK
ncbi:uncharacterized protein SEPMUDRAFT_123955 [Sphaerulina musiva SO2202]|uniref:BHLH domain-containing protein n=1 Tax=Sphaerulina musiva (strain SO2202) TaxID=692275 RepID=M3CPS5_SPHMS|nr:uncharacterized protein SEPMUDRAFT_123955 [Sphaerulina musiva SO2202]EMF15733.1 hypothetical protein SEPMUDRAFT_123955 [Sphaerulina musiva SO2202]